MEPWMDFLQATWTGAVNETGATWKVGVLAGGVILMWVVLGNLVATHIFKRDKGMLAVTLACLLPVAVGTAVWAAVEVYLNLPGFSVAGYAASAGQAIGVLAGVVAGGLLGKPLVDLPGIKGLLFLLLVYAGSVGGYLLAQASLTVLESGSEALQQEHGGPL